MTQEIVSVIAAFSTSFTRPTWKKIQVLLIGAILCRGARRITSILRVMDLREEKNYSKFHRVLNQASWSGLVLSKILFGMLIKILPESWPIIIAVDETLERRRGKEIKAKGPYRDAVNSSQKYVVICFGLKWECMTLIVKLPWCKRPWALPFLTILSPSKTADDESKRRHKTSIDWTKQMVKLVSRWLRGASWVLLGDGAYACMALAKTCKQRNVTFISRLRLDAQLFEFPKEIPKGKRGRKPVKGTRIQLKQLLTDSQQTWQSLTVQWYGGVEKIIECISFDALWYHAGEAPMPLRIVLVKTPGGKNEAEVFFSTDRTNSPTQIIERFVMRWNIEVTFEETRAHLGVETQRQWSDKAIARSTPLLMGLYSILTLVALKVNEIRPLEAHEKTAWYDKKNELSFVDVIGTVRRSIWFQKYFSKSEINHDLLKLTNQDVTSLMEQLALAG